MEKWEKGGEKWRGRKGWFMVYNELAPCVEIVEWEITHYENPEYFEYIFYLESWLEGLFLRW